jgi:Na+-driven multidrug efflux pump
MTPSRSDILRLAAPTLALACLQAASQITEALLVGRLGTAALAGYALVLPLLLLMQMASVGAMGGGVASAVARALGAGRAEEAAALVRHASVIALAAAALFALPVWLGGGALFRAIAGPGEAADEATAYAALLFAGAFPAWLANTWASVLRGMGEMRAPARILAACWLAQPILSAALMAAMGLPGAGLAYALCFAAAAAALGARVFAPRGAAAPRLAGPLSGALFRRILAVGLPATAMAALANLTTLLVTALVARHGTAAVAAYGIGVRLEFLLVPLSHAVGVALTALVGRAVGAGAWDTARRTAWRGGWIAGAGGLAIGLSVALAAPALAALFSADAAVREALTLFLRIVPPAFGAFGLGMALYFAAQGAGRMRGPLLAATARLAVAGLGGAALGSAFGLPGLFAAVAAGLLAYAALVAASVTPRHWR